MGIRSDMVALPDRIWVVGPSGSGKSTLATRLAAVLGLAATHLDDLHWEPDWVEASEEVTAARIAAVARTPRWIIDGNYSRYRRRHLERIQLIVWLDLPLHVTFPRLLRRGLRRSLTGEPCCNGNRETLTRTFLHRDSLLLYVLTAGLRSYRAIGREIRDLPHVRLRSAREADRWLARVAQAAQRVGS